MSSSVAAFAESISARRSASGVMHCFADCVQRVGGTAQDEVI
jgi:hypothetical protein